MRTIKATQVKSWNVVVISPQQPQQEKAPQQADYILAEVPGLHTIQAQLCSVWQQQHTDDCFVLPLCQLSCNKALHANYFEAHFLPALEAMVENCDVVVRQGGLSVAADELSLLAASLRIPVFDGWDSFKDSISEAALLQMKAA